MGNKDNQSPKNIQDETYQQMMLNATKTQILFSQIDKEGYKATLTYKSDFILPSRYPFISSKQINNNISTIQPIIQQASTQSINNMPISLQHNWPQTCIGLVLCEHHQNNMIYYVYGTGILIHNNIVLTSAYNVYCRRLHIEYINIKFITGVSGNKCSGIYEVMRVHYPKEYMKQEGYENYDFSVLQLYDDLADSCGYVGWKSDYKIEHNQDIIVYEYINGSKQGYFYLRQVNKCKIEQDLQIFSVSGLMKIRNEYYIVGLYISQIGTYKQLNQATKTINEWTKRTILEMTYKNLKELCNQIAIYTTRDLKQLILCQNKIDAEGCRYLSQARWTYLNTINLKKNKIEAQGCKYLSQSNWVYLTYIYLSQNKINAQGCKYLWKIKSLHLRYINLRYNNINKMIDKIGLKELWPRIHI